MTMLGESYFLFGTVGCHLCKEAHSLVQSLALECRYVDIAADGRLLERYGNRIPVLRDEKGRELAWPFDEEAVRGWIEAPKFPCG
jgi:hypothetical protein